MMEAEPGSEPTGRHLLWIRANKTAEFALVVAAAFFGGSVYVRFVGHHFIAPFALLVGLPLLAYVTYVADKEHRRLVYIWGIAAIVLLLFVARTAVIDASQLHYANCWKIRGDDESSVRECAPGRSEPDQWPPTYDPNTDEDTPGNECEYLDTSSSGGTIWRCRQT
jgi:hypothetical protein